MAYTVKQVSAMSGVSVRALHFYDETGLLKLADEAAVPRARDGSARATTHAGVN